MHRMRVLRPPVLAAVIALCCAAPAAAKTPPAAASKAPAAAAAAGLATRTAAGQSTRIAAATRTAAALRAGRGGCTPMPVLSRSLADTSGRPMSAAGGGRAAAWNLVLGAADGSRISVTAPPPGFRASSATSRELSLLSLQSAATRRLLAAAGAAGIRYVPAVGLCQLAGLSYGAQLHAGGNQSQDWAGPALYAGGRHSRFFQVVAAFRQPRFRSSCASVSDHAIWTGLGGYRGSDLIQAGTDSQAGSSGRSHAFAWFEIIGLNRVEPPQELDPARFPVTAGNRLLIQTSYRHGQMTFLFINYGSRKYAVLTITRAYGHRASYYYDGASAEVINERASTRSGFLQYRAPAGGRVSVLAAAFNGNQTAKSDGRYLHVLTMTSRPGGPALDEVGGVTSARTYSSWHDQWRRCS